MCNSTSSMPQSTASSSSTSSVPQNTAEGSVMVVYTYIYMLVSLTVACTYISFFFDTKKVDWSTFSHVQVRQRVDQTCFQSSHSSLRGIFRVIRAVG